MSGDDDDDVDDTDDADDADVDVKEEYGHNGEGKAHGDALDKSKEDFPGDFTCRAGGAAACAQAVRCARLPPRNSKAPRSCSCLSTPRRRPHHLRRTAQRLKPCTLHRSSGRGARWYSLIRSPSGH